MHWFGRIEIPLYDRWKGLHWWHTSVNWRFCALWSEVRLRFFCLILCWERSLQIHNIKHENGDDCSYCSGRILCHLSSHTDWFSSHIVLGSKQTFGMNDGHFPFTKSCMDILFRSCWSARQWAMRMLAWRTSVDGTLMMDTEDILKLFSECLIVEDTITAAKTESRISVVPVRRVL